MSACCNECLGCWLHSTALLKAIAEKLIPGIPEETRIAILQQTKLTDEKDEHDSNPAESSQLSVLEQVIEKATAKHAIEQDIKGALSTNSLYQTSF